MSKILTEVRSNGAHKHAFPDGNEIETVEDMDYRSESMETVSDGLKLKAVTQHKTVELPDLVERAQRQVQDHLKSAEQDAATYLDRISLIDAEIEKSENDKEQAEDQVRYWQAVQENTVHVIEVLKQRRAGPQAALDALRKNGIH
jgi:hypothetical protein